jgi:hypothetical protein
MPVCSPRRSNFSRSGEIKNTRNFDFDNFALRRAQIWPPFLAKNNLKKHQFSCTLPAQLCKLLKLNGAGEGNRTLVWSLENSRSTIELRPQLALSTAAR